MNEPTFRRLFPSHQSASAASKPMTPSPLSVWRSDDALKLFGWAVFLACWVITQAQVSWSGNEINYFDLAHSWIAADQYTNAHASKDSSFARIVSFLVMGGGVQVLGMEGAYHAFQLFFLVTTPLAFLVLARALKIDVSIAALTMVVFLFCGRESLVGAETLFGSIEPKSFAYLFVLLGLGCAVLDRRLLAAVLLAVAVYFHFLVGAFWGAAAFGLYLLRDKQLFRMVPAFGVFTCLVLPLFVGIVIERSGGVATDAFEISLNAIYAEFRVPHHTAPYVETRLFFADWFWGFVLHAAIAGLFALWARRQSGSQATLSLWLAGLNAYILLAALIAYLDRDTHALALFYLFRPSGLILLLSILWGLATGIELIKRWRTETVLGALFVALILVATPALHSAARVVQGPAPLASTATPAQADMIEWVKQNTEADAVIVMEPVPTMRFMGEAVGIWVGMERLLERPTLVNFKFVPTAKADLARWYALILWRQALFEGACDRITEYRVDYLITRTAGSPDVLSDCTRIIWQSDENMVLAVWPAAAP
ncbi:MAG: hypothetical protein AAGL97_09640 [Pseudomonadota bacterium]